MATATKGNLPRAKRQAKLVGSPSKGPAVAGRQRTSEPNPTTPEGQWALWLRHLIEKSGLSVSAFAKEAGKGNATVFRYMRGDVCPPLNEWPAIASALGLENWRGLIPPDDFVAKVAPKTRKKK